MTPSTADRDRRRPTLHHWVAWAASAVLVALLAYIVWDEHREARRLTEVSVRNGATLLADRVEHAFEQTDALLRAVSFRYTHAEKNNDSMLSGLLEQVRHIAAANAFVRRIGIVDGQGVNFFNTGFTDATSRPAVADRAYFQRAAAGEKGLIFDGPLQSRLTKEWTLVLARRVERGDGRFLGVVIATLPVSSIGAMFTKIDLGPSGVVNLRTADLAQVVRVPEAPVSGAGIGNRNVAPAVQEAMQRQPNRDAYEMQAVSAIDGVERVYSHQRFKSAPFWLVVGRPVDTSASRPTLAALALVVASLVAFFFWAAGRLARQRELLEQGIAQRTSELAEREQFLRGLTDALPSQIAFWDSQLRCRFANTAQAQAEGRAADDLPGLPLGELVGAQRLASEEPLHREALAGKAQRFERIVPLAGGGEAHQLVTLTPHRVAGQVQGVFAQATDITEQKRAQTQMQLQAATVEALYNEAPCGYHSLDALGRVLRINDTELRWLGRTRGEVLGEPFTRFLTPESVTRFQEYFPQLAATGQINELEMEILRQDGSAFPVLVSASVVRDDQGQFISTRTVLTDYTRLRKQQQTFQRVLTASPMAVRVASLRDHRVLFMNQAFCNLVRRSETEARGMDISTTYVDPAVFADIGAHLRRGEMVLNRLVQLHLPDRPEIPDVWALASYMTIDYADQPAVLAWLST